MSKRALNQVAPSQSKAHQFLIAQGVEAGHARETIRDLLFRINAHPRLIGFDRICKNLIEIVRVYSTDVDPEGAFQSFDHWPPFLEWVIKNEQSLAAAIGSHFNHKPRHSRDHPVLHQGLSRHPVYAALWNCHEEPGLNHSYLALQAQALCAHSMVIRRYRTLEAYELHEGESEFLGSPYDFSTTGLVLRDLSYAAAKEELLAFQPFDRPDSFAQQILGYRLAFELPSGDTGLVPVGARQRERRQRLQSFAYHIQRAHGLKSWATREGNGGGSTEGRQAESGFVDFESVQDGMAQPGIGVGLRVVPQMPPGDGREQWGQRLKQDEPPFDIGEGAPVILVDDPGEQGDHPASSHLRARNQAKHVAMANQHLPWTYSALTCQEIHDVACWAKDYLQTMLETFTPSGERRRVDTALQILVVLWTGCPFDRVRGLKIIPHGEDREPELGIRLPEPGGTGAWQIRSVFPNYKTRLHEPEEVVRKRVEYVLVPDLANLSEIICRVLQSRNQKVSSRSHVFSGSKKQY